MKIVYSLGSLGFSGGIERVISTKANYFADVFGYEVHIIVAGSEPETLFYTFSDKIQFHYLAIDFPTQKPWDYFLPNKTDKVYRQQLETKLLEIKADITISPFGRDASFLYELKDGSKKIIEFHFSREYLSHLGNAMQDDKLHFLRKIWLHMLTQRNESIVRKYKHVVLLTERDKDLWGKKKRFHVIPNPLSFSTEKKAELKNKVIVGIGRLNEQKGFDLLMRAFQLIKGQHPDWHVEIYGKGMESHEAYLLNLRKKLSLEDCVFFKTPTTDVMDILLNSSIFAFPSRYEGFGLVLTEAMECGVPCVAFDCDSGPAEIIENDRTGYLVPTQDIQLFAENLRWLMANDELRKQMGTAAKKSVERFYPENIMPLWEKLFKEVTK
ncbi:glycosyltransferase family 4 protein [Bacteroidales bacterium OttesenSCG-928-A17]|nr:glycosyltransferase family 4 protein [Bacteroidales bacterium OttesenSCG-928-A17]